jgi:hypothetical protein
MSLLSLSYLILRIQKKIVKQALQEDNYCSLANLYLAHLYEQQLTF